MRSNSEFVIHAGREGASYLYSQIVLPVLAARAMTTSCSALAVHRVKRVAGCEYGGVTPAKRARPESFWTGGRPGGCETF